MARARVAPKLQQPKSAAKTGPVRKHPAETFDAKDVELANKAAVAEYRSRLLELAHVIRVEVSRAAR